VVTQFAISIALILSAILMNKQIDFMQKKNLGLNLEQMLVVKGPEVGKDSTYQARRSAFWNEVSDQSFVKDYAVTGCVPGEWYNFMTAGFTQPNSNASKIVAFQDVFIITTKASDLNWMPVDKIFSGRNVDM
jgi:putative ABC transport system permease protein